MVDKNYMSDEEDRVFTDPAELPADAMIDEEGNVFVPDPEGEFVQGGDGFLYPREIVEQGVRVETVHDEDDEADDDEGYDDEGDLEYDDEGTSEEDDYGDEDEYDED